MGNIETYAEHAISCFIPYVSENTIKQADGDTGDSAQRVGTFFSLVGMLGKKQSVLDYDTAINAHTAGPGVYRRSPLKSFWGYRTNNFSRDQWQALQLSFATNADKVRLCDSMLQLVKSGLLHQNTHTGTDGDFKKFPDIAHPSHFAVFIRGMNWWLLWPVLCILDLFLLGDLLARKSAADYDNMLAPQMLYANIKLQTPVSKLAISLYVKTDFISCLEKYHSVQRNGILPFPALFWAAYVHHGFLLYQESK